MPRMSFTPLALKSLKPPARKPDGKVVQVDIFDESTPGLGLRVSSNNVRTWFVVDRLGGKVVRITLGRLPRAPRHPGIGLAEARQKALGYRRDISNGIDPRGAPAAPTKPQWPTFEKVAARFIEEWAKPRTRSWEETERIFERLVTPHWGEKPVGEITRGEVGALLDRVATENGPIMSNRVLSATGKLFSWWQIQDETFTSPVIKGMARGVVVKRDRVLTKDELRQVWAAAGNDIFGSILKVLMLTARRREEVAELRWEEIDPNAPGGPLWILPAARHKNGKPDSIPLTPDVWEIIQAQNKWEKCPYVFSPDGEKPFRNFGRRKDKLDTVLNFSTPWTTHDLRRTSRTLLAELGVSDEIGERVVGHKKGGVLEIYNRYAYVPEKRAALENLAKLFSRIINNEESK